jgi:23S rRNA (pseudouridine1915-N3)-methyltransferase
MSIKLVAVGKIKDKTYSVLQEKLVKQISSFSKFSIVELNEAKGISNPIDQQNKETLLVLNYLEKEKLSSYVIYLNADGEEYSDSNKFSDKIENLLTNNKQIVFLIAGSLGFTKDIDKVVNKKISLSKLTYTHKLARIMFLEQFYRCCAIKNNHPFHK